SAALVRAGSDLAFKLAVTNRGPSTATNVVVTNVLASAMRFRSAVLSQGSYAYSNGMVVCSLGNLTNGQKGIVSITVKPYLPGLMTNLAMVGSAAFDTSPAENYLMIPITADLPLLHVDNASVTEGNSGTNFAQMPFWLEGPVGIPLSLDYATTDGTALSGFDYVS